MPKYKVKISIFFVKWTLAYKGKEMCVVFNCDDSSNTDYRQKDGKATCIVIKIIRWTDRAHDISMLLMKPYCAVKQTSVVRGSF